MRASLLSFSGALPLAYPVERSKLDPSSKNSKVDLFDSSQPQSEEEWHHWQTRDPVLFSISNSPPRQHFELSLQALGKARSSRRLRGLLFVWVYWRTLRCYQALARRIATLNSRDLFGTTVLKRENRNLSNNRISAVWKKPWVRVFITNAAIENCCSLSQRKRLLLSTRAAVSSATSYRGVHRVWHVSAWCVFYICAIKRCSSHELTFERGLGMRTRNWRAACSAIVVCRIS